MARPYTSEITLFIRDLLEKNPQIVEEQRRGRALWWDKKLDLDQIDRARASRVKQQGYVYQTKT